MAEAEAFYLDTSVLLPYYREEPLTQQVEGFLQSISPPVLISDLARVEFASAVSRWVRMSEITEAQANLVESAFLKDIESGLFLCLPLKPFHYQQAERWISGRKTSLRTLDALHLACSFFYGARIVTCDSVLYSSALILRVPAYWIH